MIVSADKGPRGNPELHPSAWSCPDSHIPSKDTFKEQSSELEAKGEARGPRGLPSFFRVGSGSAPSAKPEAPLVGKGRKCRCQQEPQGKISAGHREGWGAGAARGSSNVPQRGSQTADQAARKSRGPGADSSRPQPRTAAQQGRSRR